MRTAAAIAVLSFVLLHARPAPAQGGSGGYYEPELTPEDRAHWSFKRPVRAVPPGVKAADRVRNPIDSFVLANLETAGLGFAADADRRVFLRRVTFDLTGLPPTPEEVDSFLADASPAAYERAVDRLLASPHFGERWAQHWLDAVRFAESNGYEADAERPHAWRYRDYVVRSFNEDKPYDRFLAEQVAGDEMAAGADAHANADLLVATGLHRCGPTHMTGGNLEKELVRQEMLMEMVNGFGSAVLGLTVGCARCHDHKFDPISQGDYYRLLSFFAAAEYRDVDLDTAAERREAEAAADGWNARMAPLKGEIAALDKPVREALLLKRREALDAASRAALATPSAERTPGQKKLADEASRLLHLSWDEILAAMAPADRVKRAALRERLHALEAQLPPPTAMAWGIGNAATVPPTHILKRGDLARKATAVSPGVPRVLNPKGDMPKSRAELSRWLASPDNPATARVIVNRLWQHHFGRGIVGTPNDFGLRGEKPTHPELLDWLARELVAPSDGAVPWSLKRLHRLMVTSATYRQSSGTSSTAKDRDNRLLGRMNRRRLEAESIRDAILSAAGTLNRAVGGRSVKVPLEPEVYDLIFTEGEPDGLWPVTPDAAQHARRSLYLFNKRNVRLPMLEAFDQPDTLSPCAARPVSTFAPQALILMNGPFVQEQSKALAVRLWQGCGPDAARQIESLYVRALGRRPTEGEKEMASRFLADQADLLRDRLRARLPVGLPLDSPSGADPSRLRAVADLCGAVFNTGEFVYVP